MKIKEIISKCFSVEYENEYTAKDFLEGLILNILFIGIGGILLMIVFGIVETFYGEINHFITKTMVIFLLMSIFFSFVIVGYKRINYLKLPKEWFMFYCLSLILFLLPEHIGMYSFLGFVSIIILIFFPKKNDNLAYFLLKEASPIIEYSKGSFSFEYVMKLPLKVLLSLAFINLMIIIFLFNFVLVVIEKGNISLICVLVIALLFYIKYILDFIYFKNIIDEEYIPNIEYKEMDIEDIFKLIKKDLNNKNLYIELLYRIFFKYFTEYLNDIRFRKKAYKNFKPEAYKTFKNNYHIKKKYLKGEYKDLLSKYEDVIYIFISILNKYNLPLLGNSENLFINIKNKYTKNELRDLDNELEELYLLINLVGLGDNYMIERIKIFKNSDDVLIMIYIDIFTIIIAQIYTDPLK